MRISTLPKTEADDGAGHTCPLCGSQFCPDVAVATNSFDEIVLHLSHLLASTTSQISPRDFYTTTEAAQLLGKATWTVREYCRLGRIKAIRAASGRGDHGEWRVPASEIKRVRDEGLLPRLNRRKRR
jgi:hypothetical protein